jgi:hypothetical protein
MHPNTSALYQLITYDLAGEPDTARVPVTLTPDGVIQVGRLHRLGLRPLTVTLIGMEVRIALFVFNWMVCLREFLVKPKGLKSQVLGGEFWNTQQAWKELGGEGSQLATVGVNVIVGL